MLSIIKQQKEKNTREQIKNKKDCMVQIVIEIFLKKNKDLKKGTHPTFGHSVANIFFVFFDDIKYFS